VIPKWRYWLEDSSIPPKQRRKVRVKWATAQREGGGVLCEVTNRIYETGYQRKRMRFNEGSIVSAESTIPGKDSNSLPRTPNLAAIALHCGSRVS
jgi:hypothetical protein